MCESSRCRTSASARPCAEPRFESVERRRRPAVEQRRAVVGVHEIDTDRLRRRAEMQVDQAQRIHNPIFAVADLPLGRCDSCSSSRPSSSSRASRAPPSSRSVSRRTPRSASFTTEPTMGSSGPPGPVPPAGYHGQRIPLVITPHGRGVDETDNALFWGDLPGEGDFALIDPAGEGRRLRWFSWGAPGQIADLARMPAIARAAGVNVNRHRIYAFGGVDGRPGDALACRAASAPPGRRGGDRSRDGHGAALSRLRCAAAWPRASSARSPRDRRHARSGAARLCSPKPRPLRGGDRALGRPAAALLELARPHHPRSAPRDE